MDTFLFDEFFTSATDPGYLVQVDMRGRVVPFYLKRGLSIVERQTAQMSAIKYHIEGTQVIIDSTDETMLTVKTILMSLVSWPFVSADGTPVPITEDNIRLLLADCADALMSSIGEREKQREAQIAPFVPTSVPA